MKIKNKSKILLILIIIILFSVIVAISFILWQNENRRNAIPTISLLGDENITLKMNEEYIENGIVANCNNKDVSSNVIIEGKVDTNKPGQYRLRYIAYNEKNTSFAQVERTIVVKDEIPPIITLKGKEEVTIFLNETYKDEGCTAQDNYDGDISNKVVITGKVDTKKEGEYTITYAVEDSSFNKSSITRKIIVKKKSETNSTILGKSKGGLPVLMYHFFYDASKGEKGTDNNFMEVSDFEEQMKYLADNQFYFPTWKEVEDYIDGKITLPEKSVVITIDDGAESFIKYAIPIIEKYNVKATSFVVTSWNGDWLPKSYRSSHLDFQSHSHDMHRAGANGKGRFVNLSYKEALEDVTKSKNIIGNSTIFCYPFGHYNDNTIKVLKDAGYRLAFTTKGGRVYKGTNKFALPRVRMSKGISLSSFKTAVQ
ncbi:MAG: polysaccharide deacetylase family protein [Clostridia bacterium]|nr:polysaccharide deacetylase family protein [Clostridia bacterium]